MNSGKTLFAQLMDFLPWSTFTRIVARYRGDQRVRTLSCPHYRAMAFAQLTYRESLRDIETCLSVQTRNSIPWASAIRCGARRWPMPTRRATGAFTRSWPSDRSARRGDCTSTRIWVSISPIRSMRWNSTTIDLSLAVFPWAYFRTTKAAVKMHTLLDLRGNIPSFVHVSDGKLHDVHALDLLLPEAGAIYVMDRGYVDFAQLHVFHLAGAFFVTRAKSNIDAHRDYSAPTDRTAGIVCDQTIALDGHYTSQHYPEHLRRIRLGGDRNEGERWCS